MKTKKTKRQVRARRRKLQTREEIRRTLHRIGLTPTRALVSLLEEIGPSARRKYIRLLAGRRKRELSEERRGDRVEERMAALRR